MPRTVDTVNAFNAGEFSPDLYGRSDIDKYNSAAEIVQNWLIQPEGGLIRRPGFRFVKEVKDSSKTTRLIPFEFSTTQAYVIEMGENYFRFYRNEGVILETAKTITGVTTAAPPVVTSVAHGFLDGEQVYIADIVGMPELNGKYYIVAGKTNDTFQLSGATGSGTYVSGGTAARVYTVAHTYTEAEVPNVNFAQSADVLYLVHPAHLPAKLTRTAHTTWTLSNITFTDGPYNPENTTATTLNPSADTGNITVAASATTGINDDAGFNANDVGRLIRINESSQWGWLLITAINNAQNVDATVMGDNLGAAVAVTQWRLGSWYIGNYPSAVSFGEGRLWFANDDDNPQTAYGSKSGDFENFEPTSEASPPVIADDNAVSFTIGANQVNVILWLKATRHLLMGTPGGVFSLQASSFNEPITPTNVNIPQSTVVGALSARPTKVGGSVIYIDRAARKLRAVQYSYEPDSYVSRDLMRLARHISESGLTGMEYQLEPYSTVWATRTDGMLVALALIPEEEVMAWSRQPVGGAFGSGDAVVESLAVIPSPDEDYDQLWVITKRTIQGSTVRYIEFMEEIFNPDEDDIEDAFFVDSGLSYDGAETTSITGLDHLEGEIVQILADGAVVPSDTVVSGAITLDNAALKVHVGLGYESDLRTLRLDPPMGTISSQGLIRRPTKAIVRFRGTLGVKAGRDADNLDTIPWRDGLDAMDSPPPLFTGDKPIGIELGNDREGRLFFRQALPLPASILSMTVLGTGSDR